MLTIMTEIRAATLSARARTGDAAISTCCKRGLVQVNRVTFPNGSLAVVEPLTEYLRPADALAALNAIN